MNFGKKKASELQVMEVTETVNIAFHEIRMLKIYQ